MPVLQTTDIPDLIEATLEDLGPMQLTDLMSELQEYHAFNRLLRKSQRRKEGGSRIRINILKDKNSTARWKGYYALDGDTNQQDGMTHGQVDWRNADFNWSYDEMEVDVNAGQSQIQDYIRVKRIQALQGWADFVEDWFWGLPPPSTDTLIAYPLRYWVVKNVTATGDEDTTAGAGSHSGSVPTGSDGVAHTSVGGISPTTIPRWKNYAFKWTNVTEDDLLVKWRRAMRRIFFKPPMGVNYPGHVSPTAVQHEHFVSGNTMNAFERLAEKRNDNLGYDFAAKQPTFARAPIVWAPKIDDDSDDPIYSHNWAAWKTLILRGKWMKERKATQAPNQHTVWVTWVDSRWQTICYNRRLQSVGSKAAANP